MCKRFAAIDTSLRLSHKGSLPCNFSIGWLSTYASIKNSLSYKCKILCLEFLPCHLLRQPFSFYTNSRTSSVQFLSPQPTHTKLKNNGISIWLNPFDKCFGGIHYYFYLFKIGVAFILSSCLNYNGCLNYAKSCICADSIFWSFKKK